MTAALTAFASPQALVPGDPDGLDALARTLLRYADGAAGAAEHVRTLQAGSWTGPAADAFRERVGELPRRLDRGADAFADAARALAGFADELRGARREAHRAVELMADADAATRAWQAACAAHAAAEARAEQVAARSKEPMAAIGPGPSGFDPGEPLREQARAVLAAARDRLEVQGARAARLLGEAEEHAPDEPSLFEKAMGQVGEFFKGAGEATWELGEFAFKLSPTYLLIDPEGFVEHKQQLAAGLAYGVQNPKEFAKAVLDWETWKENPARALGHLVPDLLLTLATAGAGGAARGAGAANRLERIGLAVDNAGPRLYPSMTDAAASRRLAELGYDAATPSGKAARFQLEPPYGAVDDWIDDPLVPTDRIAYGVPGISGFGVKITDDFTVADARAYFESLQAAPRRNSALGPPTVRPAVEIYEVQGHIDAASSVARQNVQFGAGGRPQVFVPDTYDLMDAGLLIKTARHEFDPGTLRSPIEDPRFRQIDPTLPSRPLDPARETRIGQAQGALVGVGIATAEQVESRDD